MGKVDPIKQFSFVLEVDGIDQFEIQEVTTPDMTIEEVEHGEGNVIRRTPGMVRYGDLTLSKLKPTNTTERSLLDWFEQVQNPTTGVGGTPDQYLRTVTIRLRDNAGNTVDTWEYDDCWLKQKTGITLSKTASDNIMEEAILVVNGHDER